MYYNSYANGSPIINNLFINRLARFSNMKKM